MGMRAYFSNRIYKNRLDSSLVLSISSTLFLFNRAKQYAFSTSVKEVRSGENRRNGDSMHVHVKKKFELNDYYANSAVQESNSLMKSQKELKKLYENNKKEQIKATKKKIKTTKSRLTSLNKIKHSIVKGKIKIPGNIKRIKQYGDLFAIHYKNETRIFWHLYAFEHDYIDMEIRKLKNRLGRLNFKLNRLEMQLSALKSNIKNVVFGSKKLFKNQFTIDEYKGSHDLWKDRWQQTRTSKMTISGRKDAKDGNFVFHYHTENHRLSFQTIDGKVINIEDVVFPYGQKEVDHAIDTQLNCKDKKNFGKPIGWSLEDKGDYYIVKCLIDVPKKGEVNHSKSDGFIGVDCNVDHFAIANINVKGQLLHSFTFDFDIQGKSSNQITKIIEAEAIALVDYAVRKNKAIAVEKLDTTKSKVSNPYGNKKANMMMSMFAYRKMISAIKSRAEKMGVEVFEVNPAYTSQIGKIKYMKSNGISIHQAAAYVIARRAMGFKEKLPPVLQTLVPEKKQGLHHWAQWNAVYKILIDIPNFWFGHLELSVFVRLRESGELSSQELRKEFEKRKENLTHLEGRKTIA